MSAQSTAPTRGATTIAVERAMRAIGVTITLAVLMTFAGRLVRSLGRGPVNDVGIGLLLAQMLLVLCSLGLRPRSRALLALSAALLVVAWALLLPCWRALPMGATWAPGYTLLPWAGWAAVVLSRRLRALPWLFAVTLACADLLLQLCDGRPQMRSDLVVSLWFLVPIAPVVLYVHGVRGVAAHLERQILEREMTDRQAGEHRAVANARAEAARLLHDHVLHALHAVAHVGGGAVSGEMASAECRTALYELGRPRLSEPTASIGELLANDRLLGELDIELEGESGLLPADVAEAMAGAAHAALENARQHARTSDIEVRLAQQGRVHQVTITDSGVGFRPDKVPFTRLGVRRSIRERMEGVGGEAVVASTLGRGTSVVLTWPRHGDGDGESAQAQGAQLLLRQRLVCTAWPGLAASAVAMPLLAPLAGGWLAVLATLGAVLVGAWASWSFVPGLVNLRRSVIALAASVAAWAVFVGLTVEASALAGVHHLWPLWACVSLMHLAVLSISPRTGLVVVLSWTALFAAMAWVALPGVDWASMSLAIAIPLGDGLVTVAALVLFGRLTARQADERRRTASARLAAARVRHAANLREFWSAQVTGEAMPLMRAVAESGGAVSAEQIAHATLLEATLRDELLLGPEQTKILATLNDLRRRGWHINTPSVTPAERIYLDGMAYWISIIGEPAHFKQEVLVTMSRGQAVLVVLDPNDEQVALWQQTAARMGAELDHDEGFARLRMALPEVPGSTYPA